MDEHRCPLPEGRVLKTDLGDPPGWTCPECGRRYVPRTTAQGYTFFSEGGGEGYEAAVWEPA
jgi:hypothetical protein